MHDRLTVQRPKLTKPAPPVTRHRTSYATEVARRKEERDQKSDSQMHLIHDDASPQTQFGDANTRLWIEVDLPTGRALDRRTVRLLELIEETGSITAAARSLGMCYYTAWLVLHTLDRAFQRPLATTVSGGRSRGGTRLTTFGMRIVRGYRDAESRTRKLCSAYLSSLELAMTKRPTRVKRRSKV